MSGYRNVLLFLLLGAVWGGAYPVIKIGVEYMPPTLFAAIRYDIAGLLLLCYVVACTDYWRPRTRGDWVNAILGGVLIIAAYNALLFIGQQSVKSAIAGILVGMMPVFSAWFSSLLLRDETLDGFNALGIVLGFLGIALIARPSPSTLLSSSLYGQLLVVGAAASMALGSVLSQRVDAEQPAVTMETWSMLIGALVLHVTAMARSEGGLETIPITTETVLIVVYLAVLSSAVAYFIYFDLLDRLGPIEMNFIAYVAAGFGAFFSWVLLSEQVDALTIVGFLTIIAGFVLMKREQIRHEVVQYRLARL